MRERLRRHLPVILLLLAVTALAYGRILGHDFLSNWDDPVYVTENEAVRGGITPATLQIAFGRFYVGNYAPLQIVSYMLDHAVWGMRPAGFLLTNILLHAINGLLFYWLLLRLHGNRVMAFAAAALFLLHPVQVESVAWISQRKNLLAMVFSLVAWHGYLSYRTAGTRHPFRYYFLALVAFLMALLAKSVAVVLPLILFCYDRCFLEEAHRRRLFLDKIPFLLAAVGVGSVALLSQSQAYGGGGRVPWHGGSPLATLFTMLPVALGYLRLIVWPSGLSVVYAPPVRTGIDGAVLTGGAVVAMVGMLAWYLSRREKKLFFWLAVAIIGLLPVAQFVPLITLMNDRYLYFPMLGVTAGAGWLVAVAVERSSGGWRPVVVVFVALCLVALMAVTNLRAIAWRDSLTLWSDAVAKAPGSTVAWAMLGETMQGLGREGEAVRCYEQALAVHAGQGGQRSELWSPLLRLSTIHLKRGELASARPHAERLVRLFPENAVAQLTLGNYYYLAGDLPLAEQSFRRTLALQPSQREALVNLGNVALGLGRPEEARNQYLLASSYWGESADLDYGLACAAALAGRQQEALSRLSAAFRRGFTECSMVLRNRELESLRGVPAYRQLLHTYCTERTTE